MTCLAAKTAATREILMRRALFALLLSAVPAQAQQLQTPVKGDDYWQMGRAVLAQRMKVVHRPQRAKNVVLMIGDGMGVATVTAARIFDGQYPDDGSPRRTGEENTLSFETMPHLALIKTYNTDAQVSDSAGTASAINTGVKTRIGYINFAQNQTAEDCRNPAAWPRTIAEMAKDQGMAVGVISTARITHATPAAVYVHTVHRNWEDAVPEGCAQKDIAAQMLDDVEAGRALVLGLEDAGDHHDCENAVKQARPCGQQPQAGRQA
jgi:alkaline phosphatase